jgi:hypothetical protein
MITPAKGIARCATLDSSIFTLLERPALSCIGFTNAVHLAVQGLVISAMGEVECSSQRLARDRTVDGDAQITCMLSDLQL